MNPQKTISTDRGAIKGGLNFKPYFDYSYEGIMGSMHRLGITKIDILHIHDADYFTHKEKDLVEKYFKESINGTYKALEELRRNGIVQAIGVGLNEHEMAQRFINEVDIDCVMLAGRYTMLEQSSLQDFFPLCKKKQIDVILAAPFNSGILAGNIENLNWNYTKASNEIIAKVNRIKKTCDNYNVPLPAAAIQFPLLNPVIKTVVTGATNKKELDDNINYLDFKIPTDLWNELKDLNLINKESPILSLS